MRLNTLLVVFIVVVAAGLTWLSIAVRERVEHEYLLTPVRTEDLAREAQRECLGRQSPHSFHLVQTKDGYAVNCDSLDTRDHF